MFTFPSDDCVTPCLIWGGEKKKKPTFIGFFFFNNLIFIMHPAGMHGFYWNAGSLSSRMFPLILSGPAP